MTQSSRTGGLCVDNSLFIEGMKRTGSNAVNHVVRHVEIPHRVIKLKVLKFV